MSAIVYPIDANDFDDAAKENRLGFENRVGLTSDQARLVAALDVAKACLAKLDGMGCTVQGVLGVLDDNTPVVGIEPPQFKWAEAVPKWKVRNRHETKVCFALQFEGCLVRWIVRCDTPRPVLKQVWDLAHGVSRWVRG